MKITIKTIYLPLLAKIFCAVCVGITLFYFLFWNHSEPTELGIARNLISGKMWVQDRAGWHITPPWVLVSKVDKRPVRVVVCSAGRGFDAKLVRFVPEYWQEFVNTEGFRYYWWANRLSFNFGYSEESRGFRDIMRGYTYSAKKYPFIETVSSF